MVAVVEALRPHGTNPISATTTALLRGLADSTPATIR